mmetsp:Transcript_25792/g.59280  ORF Transcript_25792/g.59280 Transcript_25792/m.59280 type:complete len:403 (-) Transcript_25792:55-1263(-)
MCGVSICIVMIFVMLFFRDQKGVTILSDDELTDMLENIKGNDNRLFRWDVTPLTVQRRGHGGCTKLPEACQVLQDPRATPASKRLAAEFLTFCLTDAPTQRVRFSRHEGIHRAVIEMVELKDSAASAMASHLIYSSAFANEKNHQSYIFEGAVEALANVVMNPNALTSQIMWASAALQNLAASYCSTADDGRCYWEWTLENSHVQLEEDSLPMISDGIVVRETMLNIDGLIETLTKLACTGPVEGSYNNDNVFPGENTIMGRDDNNPNLMAWAATGVLKNLALEPLAHERIEPALQCMCKMKDSPDWLEQHKSSDLILFLRREQDPCWYRDDEELLCIDKNFVDQDHYHCDGYKQATEDECRNECVVTGISAKKACCECGGGTVYRTGGGVSMLTSPGSSGF